MNQRFSVRQTKNVESKVRFVLLSRGCMRFIVTTVALCLPHCAPQAVRPVHLSLRS